MHQSSSILSNLLTYVLLVVNYENVRIFLETSVNKYANTFYLIHDLI